MTRRVCFVLNQLGGIGSGGSDRVVCLLANELVARGWAVDICALTDDPQIQRHLRPEVHVSFLPAIRVSARLARVGARIAMGIRMVNRYRRRHPESVIVSFIAWVNICTMIGTVGQRGPAVLSERTDPRRDPGSRAARWVRDLCYRHADALVFQTPDAQSHFAEVPGQISQVIGNPITPSLPAWNGSGESRTIATACRLEDPKNLPLLLGAFRRFNMTHPDFHLTVYGEGKRRADLERLRAELGLADKVSFPGHCDDVHSELSRAAFFVLSSDFEGMPNALLESMAMGMPVISTDCPIGGPRMLIDTWHNGILVPVGDEEALASAMTNLADDDQLARSLGAQAAVTGGSYTLSHIADRWESVLRDSMEGAKADD